MPAMGRKEFQVHSKFAFICLFSCLPLAAQTTPVVNPRPPEVPVGSANVAASPTESAWPTEVRGTAIFSLKAGVGAPAALLMREPDGQERVLMKGDTFPGDQANLPQEFGPFAASKDGETILFCASRLRVIPETSRGAVALGAVLGGALGAGLAGAIRQSAAIQTVTTSWEGVGQARSFAGVYAWHRKTGKIELLWSPQSLKAFADAWNADPKHDPGFDRLSMGLMHAGSNFYSATQLVGLNEGRFLLVTPWSQIELDVNAKTITPVWIPFRNSPPVTMPSEVVQDGRGGVIVKSDRFINFIDSQGNSKKLDTGFPDTWITLIDRDHFVASDGITIHVCAVENNRVKEQATWTFKHNLVFKGRDRSLYLYRQGGEDTLVKAAIDGKVLWKVNLGSCYPGMLLSDSNGIVRVLVMRTTQRADLKAVPFRMVLNSATGVIKDQDNWFHVPGAESESTTRIPVDPWFFPWPAGEPLNEVHLYWQPSTRWPLEGMTMSPNWGSWTPDVSAMKPSLSPTKGAWMQLSPDFSLHPVLARDQVEQMVILTTDGRELYFPNGAGWSQGEMEIPAPANKAQGVAH